jgi:hypothetical protein
MVDFKLQEFEVTTANRIQQLIDKFSEVQDLDQLDLRIKNMEKEKEKMNLEISKLHL